MSLPQIPAPRPIESCKVCDFAAPYLGACDFNKFCSRDWALGPKSGVNVHYHRCPSCGLIFTCSFDHFRPQDWTEYIYNEGYKAVDPEYDGTRARDFSKTISKSFPGAEGISVLDYGGGMGIFAEEMSSVGWKNVLTYDPFVPKFSVRPPGVFDLIVSNEVLEHSPNPKCTFKEIISFADPTSVIIATTLLLPMEVEDDIMDYWYIAPRNGHVTIHTKRSLALLCSRAGFAMSTPIESVHIFWRKVPPWASRILGP